MNWLKRVYACRFLLFFLFSIVLLLLFSCLDFRFRVSPVLSGVGVVLLCSFSPFPLLPSHLPGCILSSANQPRTANGGTSQLQLCSFSSMRDDYCFCSTNHQVLSALSLFWASAVCASHCTSCSLLRVENSLFCCCVSLLLLLLSVLFL